MISPCTPATYKRYRFPACANLIFQTNVVSAALTLRLYNANTGYVEITKATDSEGKFTLLTSDVDSEGKPFLLNPWIGAFKVAFIYEGYLYELFYDETGDYVSVEIEAKRRMVPPEDFLFYQFRFLLEEEEPETPGGLDYFILE